MAVIVRPIVGRDSHCLSERTGHNSVAYKGDKKKEKEEKKKKRRGKDKGKEYGENEKYSKKERENNNYFNNNCLFVFYNTV